MAQPPAQVQWEAEKMRALPRNEGLLPLPSVDELMAKIGLEACKLGVLGLYDRVLVSRVGRGEKGAPMDIPLNFRLQGNPGTGKTVVARLLAGILAELGLRPGPDMALQQQFDALQPAALRASERASAKAQDHQRAKLAAALAQSLHAQRQNASKEAAEALGRLPQLGALEPALAQGTITGGDADKVAAYKAAVAPKRAELERAQAECLKQEAAAKAAMDAATAAATAAEADEKAAAAAVQAAVQALPVMPPSRFVETSGGKLQQDGVAALEGYVDTLLAADPPGGVIFIDEAHQLAGPDPTGKGAAVVKRLVKYSEDHRAVLTFILAGYKEDMQVLLEMDPGLMRRFPALPETCFHLADYKEDELAGIFRFKLQERNKALDAADRAAAAAATAAAAAAGKSAPAPAPPRPRWRLTHDDYATIVGRRLARGAGRKGFGNGGAVEALLNGPVSTRQAERLLAWGNEASWGGSRAPPTPGDYYELTLEDVLGKRPDPSTSKAFAELSELVGLADVKAKVQQLMLVMQRMYDMEARLEVPPEVPRLNRVLLGGPGTGKTTVARIFGAIMGECGFLSNGEVVMTKPSDFLGSYVGESEAKTAKMLERAQGKVLVIDEAYGLAGNTPYHDAVQNALLSIPAEAGGDMCVLMAGYKEDMEAFLQNANQGLVRRMNFNSGSALEFHNYRVDELRRIIATAAAKKLVSLPFDVADGAARLLGREAMLRNFSNADAAMALFEKLTAAAVKREAQAEAVGGGGAPARGLALCHADLDAVIAAAQKSDLADYSHPALESFAADLESSIATAHYLREPAPVLPHCLFMGPPGTGKTTAARYLGRLLKDKALLPRDDVVETTGEELVGSFVGQTKDKVKELLQKAQGGVLFIDEAHRLAGGGGSFKTEALGALLTGMTSEEFAGKLVIVFAGYERPLAQLLRMDPGLSRRFTARIHFHAVEPLHAEAVLLKVLAKQGLKVASAALSPAGAASQAQEGAVATFFRSLRDRNPGAYGNLGDVESFSRKLFAAASARLMAPIEARAAAAAAGGAAAPERPQWDKVYTLADVQAAAAAALLERPQAQVQQEEAQKEAGEQLQYAGGAARADAPQRPKERAAEEKRDAAPAPQTPAAEGKEEVQEEEEEGGAPGGGAGGRVAARRSPPPEAVAFAVQNAFQKLGLDNDADFKAIMREGPQGANWARLAEAARQDPAVAVLQNAQRAVEEALEWCASNLAASEQEARELDEAGTRRRGLQAQLDALMASATAATEEGRREKERQRLALEAALERARKEQERLEELQRQRTQICNYCGRANTPYSGCGYGGRSPSVSWR